MPGHFISEALAPGAELFEAGALSRGEPPLPERFAWRDEALIVRGIERTWRSTNTDRGDTYLARHWYALRLADGREAVVYFDRKARRGAQNWWLYTLSDADREENPG
ncbi:MAG: hypothetical protein IAI49_02700 [Candidatus Eremiobacteraeota bacterium]|nr:hypothetical protein [Candidatus Eremiobacteraeota bacterium]